MTDRSFTTGFSVDQAPEDVFNSITGLRWWPDIEGTADRVGAKFTHHFMKQHRCDLEVKELIPGERIVWHVLHNYFSFDEANTEWNGTDILFEIGRKENRTHVKFTHVGLVPELECYEPSSNAWRGLIEDDLKSLIETAGAENIV